MGMTGIHLRLEGKLQGLGVRPALFRLAKHRELLGNIVNTRCGVDIELEGAEEDLNAFASLLPDSLPLDARIDHTRLEWCIPKGFSELKVLSSPMGHSQPQAESQALALVLADRATCDECLSEVLSETNRRFQYPFNSCANCGPRFTLYGEPPYARENSEMRGFPLCSECSLEWSDPTSRRFHAETMSCATCGPKVLLVQGAERVGGDAAIEGVMQALKDGRIVATLGVGGFHLMVDAQNENAVARLRERKRRPDKPFAVMCSDTTRAREHANVSAKEREFLECIENPIVILRRAPEARLAPSVCRDSPLLGAMLPGCPLYYLISRRFGGPLVSTSGNVSGEPLVYENETAFKVLESIADVFLIHDRPIRHPIDDSVVRVCDGEPLFLRTARGYAPLRIAVSPKWPTAVASGAHQKNTVSVMKEGSIECSPPHGELSSKAARELSCTALSSAIKRSGATMIISDLHADYGSSVLARELDLSQYVVQHHEAHAFAVAIEHGFEGNFLAFAWDGFGLGRDGKIWGGEVMRYKKRVMERLGSVKPFPLPGGERAARNPKLCAEGLGLARNPDNAKAVKALPITSSMGRLFDGVAYLLGFEGPCTYEGQAAHWLEGKAEANIANVQPYEIGWDGYGYSWNWEPMIQEVITEKEAGRAISEIAARFHLTLIEWMVQSAIRAGEKTIILSGGCFQNALLLTYGKRRLRAAGFTVLSSKALPPNDAAISVGQLVCYANLSKWSEPCA